MCGLCGAFANADHWSNAPSDNGETRAHSRQVKTRLANQLLAHYSLKLTDTGGSLVAAQRDRPGRAGAASWRAVARRRPPRPEALRSS